MELHNAGAVWCLAGAAVDVRGDGQTDRLLMAGGNGRSTCGAGKLSGSVVIYSDVLVMSWFCLSRLCTGFVLGLWFVCVLFWSSIECVPVVS
jgi:hypothetical protein